MIHIIKYLITAVIFSYLAALVQAQCPYKECLCSGDDIECTDRGLTAVPQKVTQTNPNSPSLHFENNLITTIPARSLPANLTEIYLSNNPITSIDDLAFEDSSSSLGSVTFSNALFSQLPNAFLHVNALKSLYITNTNISDWNMNVIRHIGPTVLTLHLDNVGLTTWPSWMQNFSKITDLTIVDSAISDIPDNGLTTLANTLTSLTLYSNALISVPRALTQLPKLELLYLQSNNIEDLTWLSEMPNLLSLSLSYNQISDVFTLSEALTQFSETLTEIDLDHNALSQIPDLSILQSIDRLDLSYNKFNDPNSGSVPPLLFSLDLNNNMLPAFPLFVKTLIYLQDLILNTNSIQVLRGTDFPPSMKNVVLAYNLITQITDTSFPPNSTIVNLNLNDNPISKISAAAFKNLPLLTNLDIRRTKLTRMPLALTSLTSLNRFDFSCTYGFVCTCAEKSLRSVIMKMDPPNVVGDCGITSIYNFYASLSPSCPLGKSFYEKRMSPLPADCDDD